VGRYPNNHKKVSHYLMIEKTNGW